MSTVDFIHDLRELSRLATPEIEVGLEDEKRPMYRAGHVNGFRLALEEVWEMVEAELEWDE